MASKRGSEENDEFIEDAEIVTPEGETPYDEAPEDAPVEGLDDVAPQSEPEEAASDAPQDAHDEGHEADTEAVDADESLEDTHGSEEDADSMQSDAIEAEGDTLSASDDAVAMDDAASDETVLTDEATDNAVVAAPPAPTETTVIHKRSGIPAVLGGIAAAVIGFLVAQFVPDGWPITADSAATDALAAADAEIRDELAGKADADALAPLSDQLTEITARIEGLTEMAARIEGLTQAAAAQSEDMMALTDRVVTLEDRPIVDLSSIDNSEAVEAELESLREEIAAVSAEAQRQIEAARNEATILEQNAADAADAAARRAALSRVLAALETGVPYDAMLSEFAALSDTEIPEALTVPAADGIPTLVSLQEGYAEPARAALAAMRSENAGGENTLGNFFRNQLGVRSLEPQEGDSPNAVLSRIEGAVTEGRLQDAIAEAQTLPASGAEVLAPWIANAQLRIDAIAAADALTEQQISN
ncbi:MAG: hypothetical protein AAGF78_12160 [Pseudomonadota bacterium]